MRGENTGPLGNWLRKIFPSRMDVSSLVKGAGVRACSMIPVHTLMIVYSFSIESEMHSNNGRVCLVRCIQYRKAAGLGLGDLYFGNSYAI